MKHSLFESMGYGNMQQLFLTKLSIPLAVYQCNVKSAKPILIHARQGSRFDFLHLLLDFLLQIKVSPREVQPDVSANFGESHDNFHELPGSSNAFAKHHDSTLAFTKISVES